MIIIFYFKYPIFSLFLFYLAVPVSITNLSPSCTGPPSPPPPPSVNIYSKRLQIPALLRYTGSWGKGWGGPPSRGRTYIGILGVVHTSITGNNILRNLCLRNILFMNTSQSVLNSLRIIILLHSLRL